MLTTDKKTMKNWNQKRKPVIVSECIFVILSVLILLYGVICEIFVRNNMTWFYMENISNFVLTILGAQATVCTLSITIISLISNNINEVYMGLSVSRYYLDKRPLILSQKVIISVSIGLLLVNCISYIFALYNIIFALFVIDMFLIMLSAVEICTSFRGFRKAKEEISIYFEECINKLLHENKFQKVVSLITDFVVDWSNIVENQTDSEYIKYRDVFTKVFTQVLENESEEELSSLEQLCEKQIYSSLSNDNNKSKLRGIELLESIYSIIWSSIINKKSKQSCY